jgi:hypothetical protein
MRGHEGKMRELRGNEGEIEGECFHPLTDVNHRKSLLISPEDI